MDRAESVNLYRTTLNGFPREEIPRLFADYRMQGVENSIFSREGSLSVSYERAMTNAFNFIEQGIGYLRVSASFLEVLQKLCVDGVFKYNPIYASGSYGPGYARLFEGYLPDNSYAFELERVTSTARRELERERLIQLDPQGKSEGFLSRLGENGRVYSSYTHHVSKEEVKKKIDTACKEYYQVLASASTKDEKLAAIAALCRKLKIYHAFRDGEQETIVFALLDKLLLENRFSFCILRDPDLFDGYFSIEELVQEIKDGMDRFNSYKEGVPN
jgi:hypothetical protein